MDILVGFFFFLSSLLQLNDSDVPYAQMHKRKSDCAHTFVRNSKLAECKGPEVSCCKANSKVPVDSGVFFEAQNIQINVTVHTLTCFVHLCNRSVGRPMLVACFMSQLLAMLDASAGSTGQ